MKNKDAKADGKGKKLPVKVRDLKPARDAKGGHGAVPPPPGFGGLESSGNHNETFLTE
jgi:hypothetical protein